jgi:hypothetical protein
MLSVSNVLPSYKSHEARRHHQRRVSSALDANKRLRKGIKRPDTTPDFWLKSPSILVAKTAFTRDTAPPQVADPTKRPYKRKLVCATTTPCPDSIQWRRDRANGLLRRLNPEIFSQAGKPRPAEYFSYHQESPLSRHILSVGYEDDSLGDLCHGDFHVFIGDHFVCIPNSGAHHFPANHRPHGY